MEKTLWNEGNDKQKGQMMNLTQWLVVVPARLNSQRLARKPLVDLAGKALIQRVRENLQPLAAEGAHIIVASDSEEVTALCRRHKIAVELTSESHVSGSDRCNEVAGRHPYPYVLNVQGDEPLVSCKDLRALMLHLEHTPAAQIATLIYPSKDQRLIADPNTVKVVKDHHDCALYFSRLPIPYWRDNPATDFRGEHLLHMGVYAYTRESLAKFCQAPPADLEVAEKLEQLRALALGMKIAVVAASHYSRGIDTPEDLASAQQGYNN
jgi:3-deoxy-manno-octulosonate cytidylyltransferase (CMP-KDO synthetase)